MIKSIIFNQCHVIQLVSWFSFVHQESDSLPLPKIEGDDRAQARAIAIIHSHPVASL